MKKTLNIISIIGLLVITGCSNSSDSNDANTDKSKNNLQSATKSLVTPPAAAIAPEDNPKLEGTPVLGFKLNDSTFDSVKARLRNYKVLEGESYADGRLLGNDGSGFDIEGLQSTNFAFDANNKLVGVSMSFKEANKMSHETYRKLVDYVKARNYKVVKVVAPFVGNQTTEFSTPKQDMITVNSPHLDFNIYVEYATQRFDQARTDYLQQQSSQQQNREATNF